MAGKGEAAQALGVITAAALLARLQRLSCSLSRKQKCSANRKKAGAKVAKLHARIAAIRSNALHQLTTNPVRRFQTTGIERLNVHGGQIVVADRFYPGSKTCPACAHKLDELPLSVREWRCPVCGGVAWSSTGT